jgi:hypothetical protein
MRMMRIKSGHSRTGCRRRQMAVALLMLILSLAPRLASADRIVIDGADCNHLRSLDRTFNAIYDAGIVSRVSRRAEPLVNSNEKLANGTETLNIWFKGVLPWKAGIHAFEYRENMNELVFEDRARFESAYTLRGKSWHMSIDVRDFETVTIGKCPIKTVLVSFGMRAEADSKIATRHSIYAPELKWVLGWSIGEPPKTFQDAKTRIVIVTLTD